MPWTIHASPEVNSLSEYPSILAVSLSLTAVMTIVVGTRAYVRGFLVKLLGSDDYVTFFAAVCSIAYNGLCIDQTRLGLGLPVMLRPKADAATYSVINFAGRPIYMATITGFKVALCLAYLRVTAGAMPLFRKVTWGVMTFIIVSHTISTLVLIFQCQPVAKSWKTELPGHCLADFSTWNATAAITIFCDVLTFLLPVPLFAKLQIDRRRKFGLIFLFVLGLLTTVCSVMRMVQIRLIPRTGNNSTLVLWATAEMNVGISLSSLPALTPLFKCLGSGTSKGRPSYGPNRYGMDGEHSMRLATLSKTTDEDKMRYPKEAHLGNTGSEEDILPLHHERGAVNADSRWITKTTDVYVTRDDWRSSDDMRYVP